MARSNSRTQTGVNGKYSSDIQFVTMRIGAKEKEQFKAWYSKNANDVLAKLEELVSDGYKVSLSYYFDGNCHIVSLTCKDEKSANFNRCLTSRSDDLWEAVGLTVFKHFHLCNDGIWEDEGNSNNWG